MTGTETTTGTESRSADDLTGRPPLESGVTLLWIEDCPEWAAAGNHLRGTIARLASQSVPVRRVLANMESTRTSAGGLGRKIRRIGGLMLRGIGAARRDVLIARWHPFVYPVVVAWHLRGGRVVLLVQGNLADLYATNPWTRKVPLIGWAAKRSLRIADRLITPSTGLAEWIESLTGRPAENTPVLPNGVSVASFDSGVEKVEKAQKVERTEGAYAIFIGNFATWQGIDTILAAREHPAWPRELGLRFIGDGHDRTLVEAAIGDKVEWLGTQPRSVVSEQLRDAYLSLATRKLVEASETGVSPFKVIESAAAGVPVVATRVPGQTELVEDLEGGILVDAGDSAALADAVSRLWDDRALRDKLGSSGRAAVQRYDWAARGPELAAIIRETRADG